MDIFDTKTVTETYSKLVTGLEILKKYSDISVETGGIEIDGGYLHAGPKLNQVNPISETDEIVLREQGWVIGEQDRWAFK